MAQYVWTCVHAAKHTRSSACASHRQLFDPGSLGPPATVSPTVQDACAAFFSEQLRSRDAAAWAATQVPRIWAWAEFASRDALARDCREFACRQFPEVARSSGAASCSPRAARARVPQ